jgi:hypothetical protein
MGRLVVLVAVLVAQVQRLILAVKAYLDKVMLAVLIMLVLFLTLLAGVEALELLV